MTEKKQESFVVTDRRLFTSDGEMRSQVAQEEVATKPVAAEPEVIPARVGDAEIPPAPTVLEQHQQAEAYRKSSADVDRRVEMSGHSAKDLEMTFERFMASLYMSAMMQLGLMQEEGQQPRADLIGARQTIDTLSLIAEKTKGNLTGVEQNFLQNCLYELRMAYVEVTNTLTRPPQNAGMPPGARPGSKQR